MRGVDLGARYVGSHGEHLVRRRNINQPVPGPGPLDPRRPIAGYGDILLVEPAASSSYNACSCAPSGSMRRGLSLRAAYTWSKSIDDASAFLPSDGNDNTPQQGSNPAAERGLSDFDVRHRLSTAAVWVLPDHATWWWARGWQASAIFAVQSGRPFTPRVGFDNSNTGNVGGSFGYDRPNEVDPAAAPANAVRYGGRAFVDRAAVHVRQRGTEHPDRAGVREPRCGRSRGASRWAGSVALEARLEVYNALNRANLGLPDSFVDRPTFGQSLSAYPARQLQLVARFEF